MTTIQQLFRFLGRLFTTGLTVIVGIGLVYGTWLVWGIYGQERLQNRFEKEGKLVPVTVDKVDRSPRIWWERLGAHPYISFQYGGKSYETHFHSDAPRISAGNRVRLLYLSDLDDFRQPTDVQKYPSRVISPLVGWGIAKMPEDEHMMLILSVIVTTLLLFFVSGNIDRFTGLAISKVLVRLTFTIVLGILAVFFTYDTVANYRYWQRLKASGRPMEVTILETNYRIPLPAPQRLKWYYYNAMFRFKNQERVIAIEKSDYRTLKKNGHFQVLYDASADDFVASTLTFDYTNIFFPVAFWLFFFICLHPNAIKAMQAQ